MWQLSVSVLVVMILLAALPASAQKPDFPSPVITNQDKIVWLTAEVDAVERAIESETAKPRQQQSEAAYRAAAVKLIDLVKLSGTVAGGVPSVEARATKVMQKATAGLSRLLNSRLKIGMPAEEVRQIRGRPSQVTEVTTAGGVREQWEYSGTTLSFDDGKLVEIRQFLKSD
jgi:hypothetical protein